MSGTLQIDIFIRYSFCKIYFFPRSIIINIKWKNLLKTFFFSFDLKNQICGYFYHIRNQRFKIHRYNEFQNNYIVYFKNSIAKFKKVDYFHFILKENFIPCAVRVIINRFCSNLVWIIFWSIGKDYREIMSFTLGINFCLIFMLQIL